MVAMDRSEEAQEAVKYVASMVSPENTQVVLLHVLKANPWRLWGLKKDPAFAEEVKNGLADWEKQKKKAMAKAMEQALKSLTSQGFDAENIEFTTLEGGEGVARDIIAEAKNGYDAVVVGRTGTSQLKDLVLGSTSMKLVNKLHKVPIWVIGGKPRGGDVLVAMDDSEGCMDGLIRSAKVLAGGKGRITLFHALTNKESFHKYLDGYFPPGFEEQWIKNAEKAMNKVFAKATDELVARGVSKDRINKRFVKDVYSASGAIYEQAKRGGYQTIVISRRGISAVEEFLIGGVSKKVVHLAKEQAVWVMS
jgi:nucleotide-binding universal stress UspA family protein